MAEKFTKRVVDRLIAQADPGKDSLVWDSEAPGLVLRLRSGSARFAYQYKHRGRTKRVNLGAYGALTLDEARDLARSLYVRVRAVAAPEGRVAARALVRRGTELAHLASAAGSGEKLAEELAAAGWLLAALHPARGFCCGCMLRRSGRRRRPS